MCKLKEIASVRAFFWLQNLSVGFERIQKIEKSYAGGREFESQ